MRAFSKMKMKKEKPPLTTTRQAQLVPPQQDGFHIPLKLSIMEAMSRSLVSELRATPGSESNRKCAFLQCLGQEWRPLCMTS